VLAAEDVDRPWLEATVATVEALRRDGAELGLAHCERTTGDDGACFVSLFDRNQAKNVKQGDLVHAGVALLRSPATGLVVMPRVFRKVCSNGAVLELGSRTGAAIDADEVPAAIQACLGADVFSAAVQRFRSAANVVVEDVEAFLGMGLATPRAELRRHFAASGDRTLFGLVNAATSLAHDVADPVQRLARERDAERLLCAVGVALV
jgi:hypothetical protein